MGDELRLDPGAVERTEHELYRDPGRTRAGREQRDTSDERARGRRHDQLDAAHDAHATRAPSRLARDKGAGRLRSPLIRHGVSVGVELAVVFEALGRKYRC